MKKAQIALLAVTAAFLCIMLGIFIGKNLLPNYLMRPYTPEGETESTLTADEFGKININTATMDQLTQLPGIGTITAQRIIDYRDEHGPFQSVKDLLNVDGIGSGTLDNIRDYITTGG